ncbi:MAG TPA: ABC transporter permease [Acidimicrobiales bacterium]|nr:ABC transporter permease [Acidimicrobiales bacterium]
MSEFFSLLIAGIVYGSIYAVSATGLVVTYTTTGIFNFAHGALGMILAYLFWQLWQGWHLPAPLALVIVLLVAAPLLGAAVERAVMRPLYGASTGARLAVTLGLLLMLVALAQTLWPATNSQYVLPEFFSGHNVGIGGVKISIEQLITVGVALGAALGLRVFFTRTTTGVSMRAVVDDPDLARLAGTPAGRISSYAWMIGVFFAALAGILIAPSTNMDVIVLTELVIFGYAAAVVGRLRSIPLTFLGAMVLGIAYSMSIGYLPTDILTDVTDALPMAMLLIVLLVLPEVRLAVGRVPKVQPVRPARARSTVLAGAGLVAVTAVLASFLQGTNLVTLGTVLVLGLAGLSLVPLSGYAGQVSLCQFTFLGLGALAMHRVAGGDSVLGLLAAVGLCAAVGVVVALPVLRLRGLYLALATLAFAVLMDQIFFPQTSVFGAGGTILVGRPNLFGLRFATDGPFDVLLAIVLALCLIGVGALRRGRFGRRLVAINESPAGCATVGMSLNLTKLAVFALSAGIAGLAGALYGSLSHSVGAAQFGFLQSIVLFAGVTLAGASTLSAAVAAGLFLAVGPLIHIPHVAGFTQLLVGFGVVSAGRNPAGVAALWARA